MYVYVQAVEAPGMFPLAVDVSHVSDAFVYGRHFVTAVGLQLLGSVSMYVYPPPALKPAPRFRLAFS